MADIPIGTLVLAKFQGRELAIAATLVGWTRGGLPICEGTLGNEAARRLFGVEPKPFRQVFESIELREETA
jgi:hypothetical protein